MPEALDVFITQKQKIRVKPSKPHGEWLGVWFAWWSWSICRPKATYASTSLRPRFSRNDFLKIVFPWSLHSSTSLDIYPLFQPTLRNMCRTAADVAALRNRSQVSLSKYDPNLSLCGSLIRYLFIELFFLRKEKEPNTREIHYYCSVILVRFEAYCSMDPVSWHNLVI